MNTNYPEPVVVEAPSGILDPQNALNGATVRVTYAMLDTDLILLAWNSRSDLVTPKPGNSTGTVNFLVPREAVVDAAGKTIEVIYTVIRAGAAQPSIALSLIVEAVDTEVKPIILKVTGASGDVDNGDETPDNLLTITGTAGHGVTLDVFDGSYPVEVVVAESDGSWRLTLSGLTEAEHRITARTVGGVLVSDPWSFTVSAMTAPTISNVVDAAGTEIPLNGTTFSTSVTLTGTAAAGRQVQILDDSTLLGTVTANGGNWTLALSSLTVKTYSIKAVVGYGGNPESEVRTFHVATLGRENFDSFQPRDLPTNATFMFSNGLVGRSPLNARPCRINANVNAFPEFGANTLLINAQPVKAIAYRFEFGRLITHFKFSYAYVNWLINAVEFYEAGDVVIETHTLSVNNPMTSSNVVEVAISRPCLYCVFYGAENGGYLIDNLEWY